MTDDPILSQIRKTRHRISEKCDHDPKKLVEYYIKLQKMDQESLTADKRRTRINS